MRESVATGADLTLFSGDKLLGGPQAGIIVGRADLIAGLRKNPLARTFRPGKLTLAGLEATLRLYRDPAAIVRRIPSYRLLARSSQELQEAAEALRRQIAEVLPDIPVVTEPDHSEAGGGSLPTRPFPTWVVAVRPATALTEPERERGAQSQAGTGTRPPAANQSAAPVEAIADGLRRRDLPIICRIREGALVFDVRTLEADDAEQIPGALAEVIRETASG